jgi:hypothetical protein
VHEDFLRAPEAAQDLRPRGRLNAQGDAQEGELREDEEEAAIRLADTFRLIVGDRAARGARSAR